MVTNIHDAKTHFSKLLERVARGEEIVIARAGRPIAKLVPYAAPTEPRRGGRWKGLVHLRDDFDAPLPPAIHDRFQGHSEGDSKQDDARERGAT